MSVATCTNCGSAWNVAGLQGIASISCQRCGAQIPLGAAPPPPEAWQQQPTMGLAPQGMLSGDGILATPAAPGTPIGENAIPCAHCGTVLEGTGLPVGMMLRCGRCGGTFPRPTAAQIAAAFGGQPPAPPMAPTMMAPPQPQTAPTLDLKKSVNPESSGDLELSLKETIRCPGCGREYYEEELPPADENQKIRCKRCKKVIKDLVEVEADSDEGEVEDDEGDDDDSSQRKGLGVGRRGGGRGGAKRGVKKAPPPPKKNEKVILDEKFKTDVFNAFRQGDEDRALKRCMEIVHGREIQAKQIFEHLHGIAKKKGWLGIAKPKTATPQGGAPARPSGRAAPPPGFPGAPPPPPPQPGYGQPAFSPNQSGFAPGYGQPGFAPQQAAFAPNQSGFAPGYGAPQPPQQQFVPPPPPGYGQPGFAPGQSGFAPGYAPGMTPPQGTPIFSNAPSFTAPQNAPGLVAEPVGYTPGVPAGLELLPQSPQGYDPNAAAPGYAAPATQEAPPPPVDPEPKEEGFLARVARDGRVAQLEVLVGARRFAAARDLAKALLARDPRAARALTLLSEALAGLGDDEGSLDAASKGARLEPDDARAVRAYAQALARKSRLSEATNVIRRVVGPRKGEARDAVFLADLMRRQGDEASARRIMEEVVARDPQSLEPKRQAALARAAARDLDGAGAELEGLVAKEKAPRPISLGLATELAQQLEAASTGAPPRALVLVAKALDACGKTIAAVRLLGPLVQRDPNNTDARRALGLAYARLGAAPLAEEHLKAVAGRGGAGADELRALGELALERGDAEGAVRVLVKARDQRPDDAALRRTLSRAHEQAGDLQKAVEEIEAACQAQPNDRELEAALESLSTRALAARLSALEARVREAPDDAQAHLDLGTALFEKGDATRAFECLSRAARDPYVIPRAVEVIDFVQDELDDPRPAVVLLKDLHVKAHDIPRAIQALESFLKTRPEDPLRLDLLELYAEAQRVAAAVEGLLALIPKLEAARLPNALVLADRILEREPAYHDLTKQVANARRRLGDLEGAARAFEKFLEAEPADREVRLELARTLEDAGKLEGAQSVLARLSDDTEASADELSYSAALLVRLEKHDQAIPLLKRALEKRPDDRPLKERLERAEGAVRDVEAAQLAQTVRSGRASEDDRRKLAALYAEAGKKDQVLELLRGLPGTPPGEPEPVFLRFLAEHLARKGKIDKAEAALRQLCTVLAYPAGSEQEKMMLYKIAVLYERASDRRSARRVYLELVARDPSYRDAYQKLEASEDSGPAAVEQEGADERAFVEFVETEAPRDLKTIFEALGAADLGLDQTLLAEARAAQSALAPVSEVE